MCLIAQGLAIGDGLCDPVTMTNYGDYLFEIGLIDEVDWVHFKKVEKKQVEFIQREEWVKAFEVRFE